MTKWEDFRQLILKEGLVKGDFITSGGLRTDHYYDMRKIFSNPKWLWDIANLMTSNFIHPKYKSIGCMAMGSIPLVVAISLIRNIPYFYVRPEVKKHGLQKQIEGIVKKPYLIVDDVFTTGRSIDKVRRALKDDQAPFMVIINRSGFSGIDALFNEKEDLVNEF